MINQDAKIVFSIKGFNETGKLDDREFSIEVDIDCELKHKEGMPDAEHGNMHDLIVSYVKDFIMEPGPGPYQRRSLDVHDRDSKEAEKISQPDVLRVEVTEQ